MKPANQNNEPTSQDQRYTYNKNRTELPALNPDTLSYVQNVYLNALRG